MIEFIKYITKSLVDNEQAVAVKTEQEDSGTIVVHITVDKNDLGKVIGKNGKVANAIRTVARAVARKEGNNRVVIKIDD